MKKNILTLVLVAFAGTVFAQSNFAYIYRDSVLMATPKYVDNIKKIDSLQKTYAKEIKDTQEQLNGKLGALLKGYNVKENENIDQIKSRMTAVDTTSLSLLMQEDKMMQTKAKSYDNLVNFAFQKDVQPLLDKVNKAIEKYAVTNKIDMVYMMEDIQPAVAYINRKKNITKIIIEAVKK